MHRCDTHIPDQHQTQHCRTRVRTASTTVELDVKRSVLSAAPQAPCIVTDHTVDSAGGLIVKLDAKRSEDKRNKNSAMANLCLEISSARCCIFSVWFSCMTPVVGDVIVTKQATLSDVATL